MGDIREAEKTIETGIQRLAGVLKAEAWVRAIGMSGAGRPFPEPGEGDIDLFIYCSEIADKSRRCTLLSALEGSISPLSIGRLEGGHWGQGDCCHVAGVETWLLYFTAADARSELEDILSGRYLWRVDQEYYPLGRCAMWKTMRALYDPDGILVGFKTRLADYPDALAKAVIDCHMAALEDVEDLERAVQRKDVFFYHFALDLAVDHLLQVLFARNKAFFPSRKRSAEYLKDFTVQPENCEQRLLQAIARGGEAHTLGESYTVWQGIVQDLFRLIDG